MVALKPNHGALSRMSRRAFLGYAAGAGGAALLQGCETLPPRATSPRRLLFTSAGKTCVIQEDGGGLRPLEMQVPDQATWQPCGFYPDGRILMLSMEPRRDGPGRPFEIYYHQTPTHLWTYDIARDELREIVTKERRAVFCTPALLLSGGRLLVQIVTDAGGQILNVAEDGTDVREFTQIGEGLPYGLSLSPDGTRVAFHLASPQGYQIYTSDTDGGNRTLIAAHPDHLYFAPQWSPDGAWLLFQACRYKEDPGHDWADICIARPDGVELMFLTENQPAWFAASYGAPENKGGGSNVPNWTQDGTILYPRRVAETVLPWQYNPSRPDTDHFNRDYRPESARGGTQICRLDPVSRAEEVLAPTAPVAWDFRVTPSPDSARIAFCRCETGGLPALWITDRDGNNPHLLTKGIDGSGAEHPRWFPM